MKKVFDTREYLEKAWTIVEALTIEGDNQNRFKGAMLYSTLNICDGMQILITNRNFVSANILFRSLFEYLFRSYWLSRLASGLELDSAMNNDEWPNTKTIHSLIKGKSDLVDLLADEKLKINNILHSYIHGGNQNPLSNFSPDNIIAPNAPESEVSYLLGILQAIVFVILLEFVHISRSEEARRKVMKLYDALD